MIKQIVHTIIFCFIVLTTSFSLTAQINSELLLGVTSATTAEINGLDISSINEGTLVYDINKKKVMGFIDSQWKEIMTSSLTPKVSAKITDYTLVIDDNDSILTFNSSTNITLTIPAGFPIGYNISIYQIGAGKVTIVGTNGVTVKNRLSRFKTAGKDSGAGIICTAINVFHVTGDLKI
jgi:hypothetical protein